MEKETKRALQNILEILGEQQQTISGLRELPKAPDPGFDDGMSNRIQRVAEEISSRQAFEIDWSRLCDRHYAKRS